MAEPTDSFFAKQELEVERYASMRATTLYKKMELARREMLGLIADNAEFTVNRVLKTVSRIESVQRELKAEITGMGTPVKDLAKLAITHVESSTLAVAGERVLISFDKLNLSVIQKFSELELDKVVSIVCDQQINAIKSALFTNVGIKGQNPAQVAKKLCGKEGVFRSKYAQVENIMRTETSTVYNAQALDAIKASNEEYDLNLNKRIVETIDAKRNHPISQVLNNQVVKVNDKFKAKVSLVKARAVALHKSSGGVFWPIVDGYYVGERLPAHYRERGIVVPTAKEPTEFKK